MSYLENLLTGIGMHLQAQQAGLWSPGVAVPAGQAAIVAEEPPEQPDQVIGMYAYPLTDDPALSDAVIGLQLTMRGTTDPRTVIRLADTVFEALHGLEHFIVGPPGAQVWLNTVRRNSSTSLPRDAGGRHRRSETYWIEINRPHPRLE